MNDFDKDREFENEELKEEKSDEYAYKTVMDGKPKMRTWSVASAFFAALSIVLCFVWQAGLSLGAAAVISSIVSRRKLGYFDKLSLGGLIGAIFGMVFSVAILIFNAALSAL